MQMEVDTGAAVSLITEQQQQELFPSAVLHPSSVTLRTYTAERLPVVGEMHVQVQYSNQTKDLPLLVVRAVGPALLGRDWLQHIRLDWAKIAYSTVASSSALSILLKRYQDLFRDELGTAKGVTAQLKLKSGTSPKFFRPRNVPFAIKDAVGEEIDRLEKAGILEKVNHSDWATPIVPVLKKDGKFRICGDYKVTLNPALEIDQHPLPRPEESFATLAGGQKFTTLDLSQAYQQVLLEESSRELVTINTHKGLYRYTRLPFGVASAPAIFQRTMDVLLQGLPNVMCYLDDIIVSGTSDAEHLSSLAGVLERLQSHGFRLQQDKCVFLADSVEYLGHRIDAEGLHTTQGKLAAIREAPTPQNVTQLRSFLGLLNYYGKFIANLSTLLHPLNRLLQEGVPWRWSGECAQAFRRAKEALVSSNVLAHYDPQLPLKMAADASAYGIGAVISHQYQDGTERPIAFASRTLTSSERNYAQLEKEALALVYGMKQFHAYLYGRRFVLVTDHKPLLTILSPSHSIPTLAAARLQRWALILSAYQYCIQFKRMQDHANADGSSRLPLDGEPSIEAATDATCFNLGQIDTLPLTATQLSETTRSDPELGRVLAYTRSGWPEQVGPELRPFFNRKQELSVEGNCLLWGMRVIVPQKHRERVLQELHQEHRGMSRMKSVARSYIWWPGMDHEIEAMVKACVLCQSVKSAPAAAPLHPWVWPAKPWQRIHIDFAGPFRGSMFLLVVDAHSKWPEVCEVPSTTAAKTIELLRQLFSAYSLPQQLVTDNSPQFTSEELAQFVKQNGIKHIRTSPYHPASNGAAERLVQTFKQAMKAAANNGLTLQHQLSSFLMSYRSTPHATTGESPSKLFLGREIRTRLDLLRPDLETRVGLRQASQKQQHDAHARSRVLDVGTVVMVKDFREKLWKRGVVVRRQGPLTYLMKIDSGQLWRRHIDHLRDLGELSSTTEVTSPQSHVSHTDDVVSPPAMIANDLADTDSSSNSSPTPVAVSMQPMASGDSSDATSTSANVSSPTSWRYPTRLRTPVERLTY